MRLRRDERKEEEKNEGAMGESRAIFSLLSFTVSG